MNVRRSLREADAVRQAAAMCRERSNKGGVKTVKANRLKAGIRIVSRCFPVFVAIFIFSQPAFPQRTGAGTSQKARPRPVTIVSEPNAIVWIDGVRYGTTDNAGKLLVTIMD